MVVFVTKAPEAYNYVDWAARGITLETNLTNLAAYCNSLSTVDFDLETTGFKPWTNAPLLTVLGDKMVQYVVDNTDSCGWPLREIMQTFNVGDKILRGANLKFDLLFYLYDNPGAVEPASIYDVMIAEQSLIKGFDFSCSLDNIVQRRLGVPPLDKAVRNEFPLMSSRRAHFYPRHILYAAEDCEHLEGVEIAQRQKAELVGFDLNFKINMCATLAIAKLEARGILIDQRLWADNAMREERKMMEAEKDLDGMLRAAGLPLRERNTDVVSQGSLFGEDKKVKSKNLGVINYNSGKQLEEAFDLLGWEVPTKQNKTSFAKDVLVDYRLANFGTPASEFCLKFKDYKESLKASSTYGLDFLKKVNPQTGAIHCEYNVNRTDTGRFSCQNPNMQQIPGKSSFRDCFIARPGFVIMTADYSSAELRILADFSGDQKMISILDSGGDLHGYVATAVYRILKNDPDLIVDTENNVDLRKKIKAVIFSKVYGASAKKTAELLDCTMADAYKAEDAMRDCLPEAFAFLDKVSEQALEQGYIEFNKLVRTRRYFPACFDGRKWIDISSDEFVSGSVGRAAKNAPIQGTNGDMMKLAISRIYFFLKKNRLSDKVFLLLQVHDEVVLEIAEGYENVAPKIVEILNGAADAFFDKIKMKTEYKIDKKWLK